MTIIYDGARNLAENLLAEDGSVGIRVTAEEFSKQLCFRFRKAIVSESIPELSQRLKNTLLRLIEEGYMYFGAGGALGFDTLAAQCVLSLRKRYSHIKLILVLPCTTQTKGWSKDDIAVYEEIKSQADKVVYTSHDYFRGCMFKRNRHLVNGSSVCIAYLTQEKGGTAYTVNYARQNNVQVINLAAQ